MATPSGTSRRNALHASVLWLHRWIGLTVGLLFAVVSLSGSLLLFQPQFFNWAHGELIPDNLDPTPAAFDDWLETGRKAAPGLRPVSLWPPHVDHNISDAGMMIFAGAPPGGLGNTGFVAVLVEPATGKLLGTVDIDRSPAYAPLFLHRELWLGASGRLIAGLIAVGSVLLLLIGLYLWWPPLQRLWRKLSIRPWRQTLLRAAPLHDRVGSWSLPVIFVLTATGVFLVQPRWVNWMLPAPPPRVATAPPQECSGPIGLQEAADRAAALVPGTVLRAFLTGDRTARRWELALAPAGAGSSLSETHVDVDLTCGTLAIGSAPGERGARETALLWIAGLHDGTALGQAGELIASLAGLAPIALAWSGVSMWLTRRGRARRAPESIATNTAA